MKTLFEPQRRGDAEFIRFNEANKATSIFFHLFPLRFRVSAVQFRLTTKSILAFGLIALTIAGAACGQTDNANTDSEGLLESFGLADETEQATELVRRANEDLREVKRIQKANAGKFEELKQAMADRDPKSVRKVLDEVVAAINDGLSAGEAAASKLDEATEKKTNEKFSEYLRLKEQAMRKYIEAFEFRRKEARVLRERFAAEDQSQIDRAKADLLRQEENFQQLLEAAEDLNTRANRLARENPSKIKSS